MRKKRLYKRAFLSIQAPLGDHGGEAPLPRTLKSKILFYYETLFIGASERRVKEGSKNGHLCPQRIGEPGGGLVLPGTLRDK